jgi:organic radical activating enzyme
MRLKKSIQAKLFSIVLGTDCNKNCYYCDIPLRIKGGPNMESLLKFLPKIDKANFEHYTLTGGEPGMLNKMVLDFFFDTITKPVKVNTNGLFFEKGYHKRYNDKIFEYGYHPLIDPVGDIIYPREILDKIVIYQPFTKQTKDNLLWLMESNPELRFNPIPYIEKGVYNHHLQLTFDEIKEVAEILLTERDNLEPGHLTEIMKLKEENLDAHRIMCQDSNSRYQFDFVGSRIIRCPQAPFLADFYPINTFTIQCASELILFEPRRELLDMGCRDCYYFTSFIDYSFTNSIRKSYGTNIRR